MTIDNLLNQRIISSKVVLFDLKGTLEYFNGASVTLMPDAYSFIESLVNANKRLGLVTSTSRGHAISMLNMFGISSFFEYVVSSDDVKVNKPSSEPYIRAINEMKIDTNDCIVFEDSYNGIRSAKSAGLFTVYFHYSRSPDEMNHDLADVTIESYDGLNAVFQ